MRSKADETLVIGCSGFYVFYSDFIQIQYNSFQIAFCKEISLTFANCN